MIEIVFGESACGSLKIAQTYGKGKYRGSAVSIFMRHEDGSVPSSDEMKKAQLQAQEQERIAWENAIPLGGKSSDVYCFDMVLSVGDISDNGIGEQRKNIFKKMLSLGLSGLGFLFFFWYFYYSFFAFLFGVFYSLGGSFTFSIPVGEDVLSLFYYLSISYDWGGSSI